MNELTLFDEEKTAKKKLMTVKEVSEALGVSSDTIKNCIRRLMPNKMQNGKTTYLSEVEVACISRELKNNVKVTEQLTYEAASQVKNTSTELEIIGNALSAFKDLQKLYTQKEVEYKAIIAQKDKQLVEQKPKVQWYDDVADSENLTEISTIGKLTKVGAKKIYALLAADRVIYKKFDDGVEYYASYSGYDKYFKSIPVPFLKGDKKATRYKLMFTQSGAIWASKRYGNNV